MMRHKLVTFPAFGRYETVLGSLRTLLATIEKASRVPSDYLRLTGCDSSDVIVNCLTSNRQLGAITNNWRTGLLSDNNRGLPRGNLCRSFTTSATRRLTLGSNLEARDHSKSRTKFSFDPDLGAEDADKSLKEKITTVNKAVIFEHFSTKGRRLPRV